jgi:uncharacterized membrane protein YqhA
MWMQFEKLFFLAGRMTTFAAIIASWFGAMLMFFLGIVYTVDGFAVITGLAEWKGATALPRGEATVLHLIEALDRFLIGVVLLYFGYGLYGLFIRPNRSPQELGLPHWLHVSSVGELKQTVAQVIIVILFVLFLRVALEAFHTETGRFTWEVAMRLLVLPLSIVLLAGGLRLARLHPTRERSDTRGDTHH